MPMSPSQIRSLDRNPDYNPALRPDDGAEPVRLGTALADLGDAATPAVSPDAIDLATALTLVNELKGIVNAQAAALAALARA